MKKGFKRAISLILCLAMLAGATAVTCYAAEDKCNCGHCPLIVLPGINHSPTYLYDENDKPVMDSKGEKQIGGTLLILNTDDLLKKILPKALFSLLATIATQHNILLDKVAYEAAATAFSIQKCNDEGNYVNNLKTQRWNYPLSQMTEDEVNWVYRMVPMQRIVDIIGADHTYFYTFNLVGDPMQSAKELGVNMPVGNLYSSDTFYDASNPSLKWADMGVLAIEMEAAALYCNAAYTKKRGLSICSVSDNIVTGEELSPEQRQTGFTNMMKLALETAMKMAAL